MTLQQAYAFALTRPISELPFIIISISTRNFYLQELGDEIVLTNDCDDCSTIYLTTKELMSAEWVVTDSRNAELDMETLEI